jgi:hypothetical protein
LGKQPEIRSFAEQNFSGAIRGGIDTVVKEGKEVVGGFKLS